MPLGLKNHWTYSVQTDFDSFVDEVKVTRKVPVGPVEGWELRGSMGVSKIGWNGDTLLAVLVNGQRFEPPLPILSTKRMEWKGELHSGGRVDKCRATLNVSKVKEPMGGRQVDAVMATIVLDGLASSIELQTVYVPDIGMVRQEQRSGDRRQRRIDYLSGP